MKDKDRYIKLTNDVLKMLESELNIQTNIESIDEKEEIIYVRITFSNYKVMVEKFRSNMFEACGTDWVYEFLKGQAVSFWKRMIFKR